MDKDGKKKPLAEEDCEVLINPPCKNLLANIGVGFGLDVPEPVAGLLHRPADLGYDVGPRDGLPKTGAHQINEMGRGGTCQHLRRPKTRRRAGEPKGRAEGSANDPAGARGKRLYGAAGRREPRRSQEKSNKVFLTVIR